MELLGFFQPNDVDEVKRLLANYENIKILAGGTDLLLDIRRDKEFPQYIIDINLLSELKEINESDDKILIGSMVTFSQLQTDGLINRYFNSLINCAKNMGSPQIRNMATIGGNIVNGGAAADSTPCLISLDSELFIESLDGLRKVSCENYFKDYANEKIRDNEILTQISIPKKQAKTGYYKLGKRNSLAIARISIALSIIIEHETIKAMSVCLGAVGRYPFRVKELEILAVGKNVEWLYSDEPLELLEDAVHVSINGRKTMPFKKEGIKGVYKEALMIAFARKESGVEMNI